MRLIVCWLAMSILLSACSIDPCSLDKSSPTCDTRRSEAQATISAIDADRSLRATESAVYLSGKTTAAAISADATRRVVKAEATQSAMIADATRQAITASQAQSAVIYKSTQTFVDAEATKVAVSVSGAIERANAERAAVPYSSLLNIVVTWFLIPAALVLAVLVYGRRMVHRATESITQQWSKRAAMITYGPASNPQMAFVMFDAHTGQPTRLLTTEGLIGNHLELASGETAISRLDVSDPLRLTALVEASKRAQAARIAAATGSAPWSVGRAVFDEPAQLAMPAPNAPAATALPRIPTFSELLQTWQPQSDRMMFGLDESIHPLYGRLDQLLSVIIVGRQGSGKTNLLRFIYAQCLIVGADVNAWDIHEDIIADLPGARMYTSPESITASTGAVIAELDRRIRFGEKRTARPLMTLIDELNSLSFAVPGVIQAVARIVTEGRKYNVYCVVSCKGAPADEFGKAYVRDAFSARYAFNTTTRQAAMIGFDRDDVQQVRTLEVGQALFDGPVPARPVRIPLVTADDVQSLLPAYFRGNEPLRPASATSAEAARAEGLRPSEAAREVAPEVAREVAGKAADPFAETDPVRLQIISMLRAGASRNAIIKEVYNVTGGEKYQRAAAEINQIQKELLS